jgi:hypothetical protein
MSILGIVILLLIVAFVLFLISKYAEPQVRFWLITGILIVLAIWVIYMLFPGFFATRVVR